MCIVIITDKFLFVIYNSSKVIFKLEIKKIHNCSVHFLENKYILAFRLDDGHTKGFRLEKNYSIIACQISDMFVKLNSGKKIKAVYTLKAPSYLANKKGQNNEKENTINNDVNNDDEKIDKSSYEKTLVDNDSVITFDNIDEKNSLNDIHLENENDNGKISTLKNRKKYNLINTNEARSKSSRQELDINNKDTVLDVNNFK